MGGSTTSTTFGKHSTTSVAGGVLITCSESENAVGGTVLKLEFRVQGSGFRVQGSGFRVQRSGFRVQGSGFRVQGSGFRVQRSGFTVGGTVGCNASWNGSSHRSGPESGVAPSLGVRI